MKGKNTTKPKVKKMQPKVAEVAVTGNALKENHDPRWDMETLGRAEEIKANPGRHKAARAEAHKQMQHMSRIAGMPSTSEKGMEKYAEQRRTRMRKHQRQSPRARMK